MKEKRDAGLIGYCYRTLIGLGLITLLAVVGCHASHQSSTFGQSIWGDFHETRLWMDQYKHVVLVQIYEDHSENRGLSNYSLLHFRSTVVRSFKGDWRASEELTFMHGIDAPAEPAVNAHLGQLFFVFTNEHTINEFGVDTADFMRYDSEIDRQLSLLFVKPEVK